jgi:hypothetical protein
MCTFEKTKYTVPNGFKGTLTCPGTLLNVAAVQLKGILILLMKQ